MFIKKFTILAAVALVFVALQPLTAQTSSDSARLEKLERAVEQLQKRNVELESEVKSLKKQTASAPAAPAAGSTKTKITSDGKTYVEKNVAAPEKPPAYVLRRGPESKLTLGGLTQLHTEAGDVSACEGRFGWTELKYRFRSRRARFSLTGASAASFDF